MPLWLRELLWFYEAGLTQPRVQLFRSALQMLNFSIQSHPASPFNGRARGNKVANLGLLTRFERASHFRCRKGTPHWEVQLRRSVVDAI